MNFLRRLALQEKKKLDSSCFDVVEIARVPGMLPSLFPSWSGLGLMSTPAETRRRNAAYGDSRISFFVLSFTYVSFFVASSTRSERCSLCSENSRVCPVCLLAKRPYYTAISLRSVIADKGKKSLGCKTRNFSKIALTL